MTRPVAVLCAARNSIYHALDGVEVYDAARDARTFPGGMPVICHPPCRSWSAFCRQQAKPAPGEQELGIWCAEQLRQWGGILEQPAFSHLFAAAGLPLPGRYGDVWTLEVWQAWWGYPTRKRTWLAFCGIDPAKVHVPYRLHAAGRDRRRMQVMSHNQRSATSEAIAKWLVDLASIVHLNEGGSHE